MSTQPRLAVRAQVGEPASPRLDVDITVDESSVVGVIGPNGAGKTTLLRTIAGLEDAGRDPLLSVMGRDVTASPASRRGVAYVPQQGALFPHLSVTDNVAYGLRASGVRRRESRVRAQQLLTDFDIAELADRSTKTLSGGQAQRVAIARALAVKPEVILLDEPTASLDAQGQLEMRRMLRRHVEQFSGVTVLVTHDASEVLTLADRVIVLDRGRVSQDASSADLVRHPGSAWLAHMLRLNAWNGTVIESNTVQLNDGGLVHAVDLPQMGAAVLVTVSPTAVALFSERPTGSLRNVWPTTVDDVSILGDRVRVFLSPASPTANAPPQTAAEITRGAAGDLGLTPGASVFAAVKATELTVSPT